MQKALNTSTFELEKDLWDRGYVLVIGTDEVGRGPLCGPVVAAAAVLKDKDVDQSLAEWDLVRDSKKLSEKQREKVFDFIQRYFHVGIGLCDHETIDRINILEASFLAMKKAITALTQNLERETLNEKGVTRYGLRDMRKIILVDGNKEIPNLSMEQKAVIGGDKFVKSISAASIVAKVTRDRMMHQFAQEYPGYGLEKHMGYGTKMHMDALNELGPCKIHRKSFAPVKKALKSSKR